MVCVPVCLNLYVWKSAPPLLLCWRRRLSKLTSPQQKDLGIGRMPEKCLPHWRMLCVLVCLNLYVKICITPAYVGHEDCLYSVLTSPQKKAWGSAECFKVLATVARISIRVYINVNWNIKNEYCFSVNMFRIITYLEDHVAIKLHTIILLYFNNYLRYTHGTSIFKHVKCIFTWINNN